MKDQIVILLLSTSVLTHISFTLPENLGTPKPLGNDLVDCFNNIRSVISDAEKVAANHTDFQAIIQCGKDAYNAIRSCGAALHNIGSVTCRTALSSFITKARNDAGKLIHDPRTTLSDVSDVAHAAYEVLKDCRE